MVQGRRTELVKLATARYREVRKSQTAATPRPFLHKWWGRAYAQGGIGSAWHNWVFWEPKFTTELAARDNKQQASIEVILAAVCIHYVFPEPEDLFFGVKIPLCVGSSLRGSKRFPGASRGHGYQSEIMGTDGRRLGSLMVFPRRIWLSCGLGFHEKTL